MKRTRREPCDPASLERGVRQLLADKVSANLVGLWLLIPEHLRLGTWDLLCGWSGQSGGRVEPRLALQLVHEAALTLDYPKRWHVEEFFNAHQALGWKRAGTLNLNIRYGQMTMALLAQAVLHRIRRLLGEPYSTWDASHFAKSLLAGLEGDIRVRDDTIVVTYYNAPNVALLREHYEDLPDRLESEHVDPHIPWLYGFKLDFRFR